jgi:hypothetical protein
VGNVETWEYLTELVDNAVVVTRLRHLLNLRGSEGWELVSFSARVKPVMGGTQGGDLVAVFKRPGLGPFDRDIAEPPAY